MKINRKDITEYEDLLNEATALDDKTNQEKYTKIFYIVESILKSTEDLEGVLEKVIFLLGPSGAGKSALMNFLVGEDNLIVSENVNGELMLEAVNSVTLIG